MTQEAVAAFVERLTSDVAFRDQLAAAASPEERQRMATEAGYDIQPGDAAAIQGAMGVEGPKGVEELADADLEAVAGGWSDEDTATAAISAFI